MLNRTAGRVADWARVAGDAGTGRTAPLATQVSRIRARTIPTGLANMTRKNNRERPARRDESIDCNQRQHASPLSSCLRFRIIIAYVDSWADPRAQPAFRR